MLTGNGRFEAAAAGNDVNQRVCRKLPHFGEPPICAELPTGMDASQRRVPGGAVNDFIPERRLGSNGG